ncbi:hypothetical protein M9458_023547, partial [Cirrhinus mrigala]
MLTVDFTNNNASPTLDPVSNPPSPHSMELQPKPTADGEPKPSATDEPSPSRATELRIAPKPEPVTSDQVREPAILLATEGITVERKEAEESPAHCTSAE